MKLWLDDVRKPPDDPWMRFSLHHEPSAYFPDGWVWCKSYAEAVAIAEACDEWALDHDLGGQLAHYGKGPYDFTAPTGTNFVMTCQSRRILANRIAIHSTNFDGALTMVANLYTLAREMERDIEIIVRPMRGRIMDKTPYYEEAMR